MSQKQKTAERERKKERLNDGNNNGQATHGARMAHASRLGKFNLIDSNSNQSLVLGFSFFFVGLSQMLWPLYYVLGSTLDGSCSLESQ